MNIFKKLISEENILVEQTLNNLQFETVNTKINAYLLNLCFFHRDTKIRNVARKKIFEFGLNNLILQTEANWQKDTLKEQKYYQKELYENPLVDASEFITIGQVTRKNYFLKYKKSKFLALAHMRYDDDIENIFDCYQVPLEKLSDNLKILKHITVANFHGQTKLNFDEVVQILSTLPNIKFLQIAKSNLGKLPSNLDDLKSLKRLIIEYNPIDSLGNYKSELLERLEVKGTKINEIDLNNFPNLKELWVDDSNSKNRINIKNKNGTLKITSGAMYSEVI
ncbi:hypothetical protein HNQ02_000489 [Flavobacterium sp. 7E]|uniref:hypothetical protein n=1 Tax=Flavobacterium sp. 7E TaxID=2735898 RepID=UPI0015700561|nr:hypothetical protein [Flavobacterium sp. 7E]NRS87582.1 hypothetical protein [Flavobacterium sp. 7E]